MNKLNKEDKMPEELLKFLDEKLNNNEITKYDYDELKSLDFEYDGEKDPIELFKIAYIERKPNKCSKLLLDIYNKHKHGFRKAVLLNECFLDPLGIKYNAEVHEFNMLVINRAYELAHSEEYPRECLVELSQLYLVFKFFNHNNLKNTEKLNKCEFMDYSLSEAIRMMCIFIQDQRRIEEKLKQEEVSKKGFFTGMEGSISNKKSYNNPNMLVSFEDNFEGVLELIDILIRYLYFKKNKEYKQSLVLEHGDITYTKIPEFELIILLASQRNLLTKTWEKFKYSQWDLHKMESKEAYVFKPKFKSEYKEQCIANNRRKYSLMIDLFKKKNINSINIGVKKVIEISKTINKKEIKTLFEISKEDYFIATKFYQSIIDSYKSEMHDYYLGLKINGLKVEDIFRVCELLNLLSEIYKNAVYRDFDEEDTSHYKYLCPIIPIKYFVEALSNYYGFDETYSFKLINCFVFNNKVRSESDIFSRPLISINSDNIVFCPALIGQMNLERIIEMLISQFNVNIAQIGIDFENKIKSILSYFKGIKVNTNKIEFMASDGRNVEFDFIGTFDDHLLLWEFKALTVPYSEKRHLECKKTIMEGVNQIKRRTSIIKSDWKKIRELANIDLPEEPFEDDKIIKLVGTNIFDFTTLVYEDNIMVVDESTLLKFFIDPKVELKTTNNDVLSSKKLWENTYPTVSEFKSYLENPVTTSCYDGCIEEHFKEFTIFKDEYAYAIIDQILKQDPYAKAIEDFKETKKTYVKKKKKKKKRTKKNKKRKY